MAALHDYSALGMLDLGRRHSLKVSCVHLLCESAQSVGMFRAVTLQEWNFFGAAAGPDLCKESAQQGCRHHWYVAS